MNENFSSIQIFVIYNFIIGCMKYEYRFEQLDDESNNILDINKYCLMNLADLDSSKCALPVTRIL